MRVTIYIALSVILFVACLLFLSAGAICRGSHEVVVAKSDVVALSIAIDAFKAEYGYYPKGSNREILSQLMGGNPRKVVFIELKPGEISSDGEFLDPWKHPYQINLVDDPKTPRVWSLGKNGIDDSTNAKSDDIRGWR